uniref:Nicolin-1 n=2 Tax=Micrurus TaxID=8634 RepID=A0A2D4FT56_MICCO
MALEPVPCAIKNPVVLQVGDMKTEIGRPGVLVIDVSFPHSQTTDLQAVAFKNYYTAFLTLRVQRQSSADDGTESPSKWVTCLRNFCLMPNPHAEEGSQNYFSISRHQMLCDVDQVAAMRFILRQPSPVWLHFTIEELQLFSLCQKGLPDADRVSSELQQMWILTEMLQANQPVARIGRFDIEDSYDLNLLSYI